MKYLLIFLSYFLFLAACSSSTNKVVQEIPTAPETPIAQTGEKKNDNFDFLDYITLPEGFKIHKYHNDVGGARSMCLSPSGTVFIGTRSSGKIYAIQDLDGDHVAEKKFVLAEGLKMPNGVALKDGDLYVAEIHRILKYDNIEQHLEDPPEPTVVYDQFPKEKHHGWKYIAFGPDGMLYVPVGAPCNTCESDDEIFATITKMTVDDPNPKVVQTGIRNTVGFTWHPTTNELWFTDNGADWMGDDLPACELNHAPKDNMHFGFPFCHQGDVLDDRFGKGKDCDDYTAPAMKLGPHVAPLGLKFYTGTQFPQAYRNQVFIAEHGSWNRETPIGYRVTMVTLKDNKAISYEPFASGWLDGEDKLGRPVDILILDDGSMLVSDDYRGKVYRIYYDGK